MFRVRISANMLVIVSYCSKIIGFFFFSFFFIKINLCTKIYLTPRYTTAGRISIQRVTPLLPRLDWLWETGMCACTHRKSLALCLAWCAIKARKMCASFIVTSLFCFFFPFFLIPHLCRAEKSRLQSEWQALRESSKVPYYRTCFIQTEVKQFSV